MLTFGNIVAVSNDQSGDQSSEYLAKDSSQGPKAKIAKEPRGCIWIDDLASDFICIQERS